MSLRGWCLQLSACVLWQFWLSSFSFHELLCDRLEHWLFYVSPQHPETPSFSTGLFPESRTDICQLPLTNVVGAGLMGTILLWLLPTQKCSCTSNHTIEHGWIVGNGSWSLILLLSTSQKKSVRAKFTTSWTWDLHHSISTQGRFKQSKWCPHMLTRWAN